jgi:hypothetical protein
MWTEEFGFLHRFHHRPTLSGFANLGSFGFLRPPTTFHGAEAPRGPCRRSGDPPRFSWEGKLELTEALRPLSQPREFQKVSTQENPEGLL